MNRITRTAVQVALVVAAISWGSQTFSQDGGQGTSNLLLECGRTLNAQAVQDLRQIAAQTGGAYDSIDACQTADVFMAFMDTFTAIEMSGVISRFNALPLTQEAQTANTALWGALAIDSNQGPSWGWAINYSTVQEAEQRALAECGNNCHVVMRFSDECGAFAADQEPGSTVYGWGKADSSVAAQNRALSECQRRGGTSCRVRAWGCTQQ